jgi:hypothetical protein
MRAIKRKLAIRRDIVARQKQALWSGIAPSAKSAASPIRRLH